MTRVVLARHGETLWHTENRYAGVSDVPLTRRGRQQAASLANWARAADLDAVWASALSRSRQTAAVCAKVCALSVHVDERLREVDFGAGEGLTTEEMAARFPAELQAFRENPVVHHLPGGEDPVAAAARFVSALLDLSAERPYGRILVVAHTTVIRLAVCQLIGVPLVHYRRVFPTLRNCGRTELSIGADGASVIEFNTPIERDWTVAPWVEESTNIRPAR